MAARPSCPAIPEGFRGGPAPPGSHAQRHGRSKVLFLRHVFALSRFAANAARCRRAIQLRQAPTSDPVSAEESRMGQGGLRGGGGDPRTELVRRGRDGRQGLRGTTTNTSEEEKPSHHGGDGHTTVSHRMTLETRHSKNGDRRGNAVTWVTVQKKLGPTFAHVRPVPNVGVARVEEHRPRMRRRAWTTLLLVERVLVDIGSQRNRLHYFRILLEIQQVDTHVSFRAILWKDIRSIILAVQVGITCPNSLTSTNFALPSATFKAMVTFYNRCPRLHPYLRCVRPSKNSCPLLA